MDCLPAIRAVITVTNGFDDRKNWAAQIHREYLEPAICAYWDVDSCDVWPVSPASDGDLPADLTAGVCVKVRLSDDVISIAERVRTRRDFQGAPVRPDFSIRQTTATGQPSEYHRLLDAYTAGQTLPEVYLFAVTASTKRKHAMRRGLSELFFIDTRAMLASMLADELDASVHDSSTGETTRYYSVTELQNHGCIRDDVAGDALTSATDENRQLEQGFPTAKGGVWASKTRLEDFA